MRKGVKLKVSFVIPVYQNEGALSKTYANIYELFKFTLSEYSYEIIFVDDGSTDGSLEEILELNHSDQNVKVISFTRNFGQMAAMIAGFKEATGNATINISADMQDPAELIPEMIKTWNDGAEIVICYRTDRSDNISAKLFSKIAYALLRYSIPQIPAGGFDFVLMDRKVLDTFNGIDVRHRFFQGDLLWTGYKTSFIPYVRLKRTLGKSQYNFTKKLNNFLDAILDASNLPIRFISLTGIVVSIAGILYGVTIFFAWLTGKIPFQGWAPIMMVILILGGLTLLRLGIIGEYIWRINSEVRKKPNYIIREKIL